MQSTPSTEILNQAGLAKRLGVSRQYVNQLVLRGVIELKDGLIGFDEAVRAIEAAQDPARPRTRPKIAMPADRQAPAPENPAQPEGDSADPSVTSYQVARTIKEKYAALHRKLDYERACGTLIPVDQVVAAWESLVAAFRAKCLALPSKLAPQLAAVNEIREIEAHIAGGVREALEELSRFELADGAAAGDPESGESREAAAQAQRKRVGRPKPAAKPRGQRRARPVSKQ
ncbi:MAG: hypothetical protein ACREU9_00150 [Gammaproteobacteria bacterium]